MKRWASITGALLLILLLGSARADAQALPKVEIGTQAGLSILRSDGDNLTTVSIPGGGFAGMSAVYATFFPSSNVALEPRLSFNRVSDGDFSLTVAGLDARLKVLVNGALEDSFYLYGAGSVLRTSSDDDSESDFAAGAGIGFRKLATDHLAVNFEGGYRRWFIDGDESLNEFTLSVGVGAVVGGG